ATQRGAAMVTAPTGSPIALAGMASPLRAAVQSEAVIVLAGGSFSRVAAAGGCEDCAARMAPKPDKATSAQEDTRSGRCNVNLSSLSSRDVRRGGNPMPRDTELPELFERIEDFEPGPLEAPIVSRGDSEPVATRRRRDVAVLDWHSLTGPVEPTFLL